MSLLLCLCDQPRIDELAAAAAVVAIFAKSLGSFPLFSHLSSSLMAVSTGVPHCFTFFQVPVFVCSLKLLDIAISS